MYFTVIQVYYMPILRYIWFVLCFCVSKAANCALQHGPITVKMSSTSSNRWPALTSFGHSRNLSLYIRLSLDSDCGLAFWQVNLFLFSLTTRHVVSERMSCIIMPRPIGWVAYNALMTVVCLSVCPMPTLSRERKVVRS